VGQALSYKNNERIKMMALEIHLKGKRACSAGNGGLIILSAAVTKHKSRDVWDFRVRGITEEKGYEEHLSWIDHQMKVGDTVTIKLIETKEPDKPKRRYRIP